MWLMIIMISSEEMTGCISNITFIAAANTQFTYLFGLFLAHDCKVENCTFDVSRSGVDIAGGKILSSVNNVNIISNCNGYNIVFSGNTIIYQNDTTNRNNCESIGIEARDNVIIENNKIVKQRDDVGIHGCSNVIVRNNNIESYDGRIYSEGSVGLTIENNRLYYTTENVGGMGIFIEYTSLYPNRPSNIVITKNHVYKLNNALVYYGVRLKGVKNTVVSNNILEGNTSPESVQINEVDYGMDNVTFENNQMGSFIASGLSTSIIHYIALINNIATSYTINGNLKNIIVFGNKVIESSTTRSLGIFAFSEPLIRFSYYGNLSSSEKNTSYDGKRIAKIRQNNSWWNGIYRATLSEAIVSGYITVNVYVNNTLIAHQTITPSINYSFVYFESGNFYKFEVDDEIEVKVSSTVDTTLGINIDIPIESNANNDLSVIPRASGNIGHGVGYYNNSLKKYFINNGTNFVDCYGYPVAVGRGATADRPKSTTHGGILTASDKGYPFYDETLNRWIFLGVVGSDGTEYWKEFDGAAAGVKRSGTTANRPTVSLPAIPDVYVGFEYFDTDLGKPIFVKSITSSGVITWVDATGTTV